jgi:tetratricopeptide (TPR) repeat protein
VPALLHLLYRAGFYLEADTAMRAYLPCLRGRGKYKAICLLIEALRVGGKYDKALWWCDYIMKSRFANRPENAEILSSAFVVRGLLDIDRGLSNFKEIESRFQEGLRLTRIFEALQTDHSQKAAIQVWKARIYNNLGLVALAQKHYARAIANFEKSLRIKEKYHDETSIAQTQANLAKVYLSIANLSRTAACMKVTAKLMRKSPSKYICLDTIAEILGVIAEMVSVPTSLARPKLPIPKGSKFWRSLNRYLARKKSKAIVLIPELKKLNDILLDVTKP